MDFTSMTELLALCESTNRSIAEVMVARESAKSGRSEQEIVETMKLRLVRMKEAIDQGVSDQSLAPSGISGGDAYKLERYLEKGEQLTGPIVGDAMKFAFATSEMNARMGIIVATPTAGSAGILPGCLFSLHENQKYTFEHLVMGLFTASAIGYVIANRAFISGAAGGCQAEVGSATAMAAAALVEIKQGTPRQAVHAAAIALKSLLGLVCDPVAGLVEVPCIKRNVIGSSIAFSAADIALAGIESQIPCDEVIGAMYEIGKKMPRAYRETALGGLAVTPTGEAVKERIMK
ncbi:MULTISPECIES: L-serine ammonia-lyase, iron-sulfur-dependent, subunit alpha [Brevibacillus]|jgi:L-serine dehydratase|uniref:L-serine dehydratase n=1 Tax=Brevibacillus parabrevis TaxID=54914 RepID=A0A4Y3P8H2_BREPA|nr:MULTISPECIES: L-serine ammonia-lyase, iron-sulfur-dependent, subunit alpha [Brevibacillus]MDH6348402.1 L-serine dehydratase [Brevibacillus sp. 1238]MDR5000538.1 L-serine ammonia-lyase, iron-sulfur-dependent, subunit alpha [Brevibacillus parabrevis]MED2256502.1 L-serine ammonia-lyase, iron-sulfur-dependent, subunit alpha [Brevibacillus parabrevis]RNB96743.1 L-serine ammonia-lyase, iron-sulfur-dependent, subunit alpha [Brevibacillus parabrevis]WDV96761.1 L-serine ammonia-lyase, iron-sulfur-de